MAFIVLDNKNWCKGIYQDGDLHFSEIPNGMKRTWRYAPFLENKDIQYASIYSSGKSIDQVCPDHLKEKWNKAAAKLKAYHNSFVHAKINLKENCFFDLVPHQFLKDFCEVKSQIIEHVIDTHKKPENHDFLLEMDKFTQHLSERKLNIDLSNLKKEVHNARARTLVKRLASSKPYIDYNIFGSKTGRLTTNKNSFPILNLDSNYRSILKPTNDIFVELDYNSAELRVLLSLAGQEQPAEDIHSWNAKKFSLTREEAKKEVFAWLYGSSKIDSSKYEQFFNPDKIKKLYYDGEYVKNIYGRKIKSDDFHSLNYIIQSTTSDMVLEQTIGINKKFKNKKSFIAFMVHDSVVIDLAKDERELLNNIIESFSKTRLGQFPANVSIGKNYGTLRKI